MNGRSATNIPKLPSPASNHTENLSFKDQRKESPNSIAETGQPFKVLHIAHIAHTGVSLEAGLVLATSLCPPPSVHAMS